MKYLNQNKVNILTKNFNLTLYIMNGNNCFFMIFLQYNYLLNEKLSYNIKF